MNFITIPAFVTITYLLCELYKWYTSDKGEHAHGFISILAGIIGLVLGVLGYFIVPSFLEAENVFVGAAIGISSGLAAVGVNQIITNN